MERRAGRLGWLAAVAAAAAGFVYFYRPIHDDDVWLHFAAGRWILEHLRPPSVDSFSCTSPGAPYVDHEWLAQALFESLRRLGGLPLFRAALAACAGGAFAVAARTMGRAGASAGGAILAVASALLLDWHLARLRPHLLSLLLTVLVVHLAIARTAPLRGRTAVAILALAVVWANVHGAAVIAPALLLLAAAGAWLGADRARASRLAALSAGAAACLLVNPYGLEIYRYAFATQELAPLIPEWKPLLVLIRDPELLSRRTPGNDFRSQVVYVSILAAATIALAGWTFVEARAARRRGRLPAGDPALAAPAAALALLPFQANRHDLFLIVPLVFCAITAAALARRHPRLATATRVSGWVAGAIVALALTRDAAYRFPRYREASGSWIPDVWPPHEPFAAVEFLERTGIEGCCLNRAPWGGYLLYRRFPSVRVAFDGRITTLGADVYRDVFDFFNGARCAEVAERYGFDLLLAPPWLFGFEKPLGAPGYVAPDLSRDWLIVYRDADPRLEGSAVVALRRASPLFERNLERARPGGR
jgi:hypothetical protein